MKLESVKQAAELAKIELSEEESIKFNKDLELVLAHFEKISLVDTTGIKPLHNVGESSGRYRKDKSEEFKKREKIVDEFPESSGSLIKVPKVL